MNPRTLYKKTCSCRNEQTQHVYIQTLYMWALPVKLNSTDCTHGHCPYSFTRKPGCFSPPVGTAPGNVAPRDGEDAVSAGLQTSLAAQQVEILHRCWVSPSCLSCTWLPPAGSWLKPFLRAVHLHIMASLGKDIFTEFSVQLHDLKFFQPISH